TLDRLPDDVVEAVVATGYLRCAADPSRPDFSTIKNADAQYFYPTLNDTLQIVASSTLGLTLQCARCHSHKYDPIPQADYDRLQAIFMPALRPSEWIPLMDRQIAVATESQQQQAAEHNAKLDAEIARITQELTDLRNQHKQRLFAERLATLPEAIRSDVQAAISKPAEERTEVDRHMVEEFGTLLQPEEAPREAGPGNLADLPAPDGPSQSAQTATLRRTSGDVARSDPSRRAGRHQQARGRADRRRQVLGRKVWPVPPAGRSNTRHGSGRA